MLITFLLAIANLFPTVSIRNLMDSAATESQYSKFVLATLPYYLASFACYPMVPSLLKYYGKKPKIVSRSVLYGTLISFSIYLLWLLATMGNLGREPFLSIVADGGNIGVLVAAINLSIGSDNFAKLLGMFANMAIVSSFLAVSLSLFDFIADRFKFDDSGWGRFKTALLAFLPPTIGGLFFPNGFIYAIGYAGLILSVSALIIPPLMLQKSRQLYATSEYRLHGGRAPVIFVMTLGGVSAVCHVLAMMGLLPVYGQ
jgi:tryptophan-specific transport protein